MNSDLETFNYFVDDLLCSEANLLKNELDLLLMQYIFNSIVLLLGVLFLTFIIGVGCAYIVSFYKFPGVNFFKWALILSFAIPAYIYAYSLTAFFENFGTAFSILKNIFGEGDYNKYIPKLDGMLGAIISISLGLKLSLATKLTFMFCSL